MLKRTLKLAFLMMFSASVCFAQWTGQHEIKDFSKLLNSHVNPFLVKEGAAVEAKNLRANRTYGALAKRPAMLSYGSAGSYAITGLHRYYQSDGNKYLIAAGSTYLRSDKNNSGTFITIRDELTNGRRWQFVTYQNKMIGVNGADNPQKYDGHTQITANTDGSRTENILTADLGAPYAEQNTGSNLDASSWYQYKVAFYTGSVYYFSNARSNPILTGSTVRDITLTDIPLGPSGTTHRYIYRTLGNASRALAEADTTFYLVGTIANNTASTFNDSVTDDTADNNSAPTWATVSAGAEVTPPVAKFANIHKERLWLARNPVYASDIYWSYPFKPDIFNASDYEQIRPDDGDEITFIKNQLGIMVIGKTNSVMKFSTISADSDQWVVLGPYSYVGCQAPYSAVNSPLGIIYLAKNGIYVFNGESSQLISDVVTPELRDILWTNRDNVASIYYDNEYQMSYTSVESGASANDKVIVFDVQRDAYSIDEKSINVFTVFDSGTDEGTLYSASSASDGNVYSHSFSSNELIFRTRTDLETGTMDSVGVAGADSMPVLNLTWGMGCDDTSLSGVTTDSAEYSDAITDRPTTSGYWYSPIVEINATDLDKLYWSESLGGYGSISLAVRLGATAEAVESAEWSSEFTSPAGSDISSLTANNYAQIRVSFVTTNILYTPSIVNLDNYAIRLSYSKEGAVAETTIPTLYKTGWLDFGVPQLKKRIWEIEVFYEGTSGDFNFTLENLKGDISQTFTVDLSVSLNDDAEDSYTGNNASKSYIWYPSLMEDTPIGEFFQYTIEDNGINDWKIFRIITRYSNEDIH